MYFENQTFLVAGLSRSGIAAAEYLRTRGAEVFVFDDVEDKTVEESSRRLSFPPFAPNSVLTTIQARACALTWTDRISV